MRMKTIDDTATQARVFETAVASAYDSVLVTDADFQIVYANAAFTQLTGYSREEVQGRTPGFLQGEATDPDVIARLHSAIAAGAPFEGSTVNYRKDGSPFDIRWSVVPVQKDDGTVSHYVTVQRDVTPSA